MDNNRIVRTSPNYFDVFIDRDSSAKFSCRTFVFIFDVAIEHVGVRKAEGMLFATRLAGLFMNGGHGIFCVAISERAAVERNGTIKVLAGRHARFSRRGLLRSRRLINGFKLSVAR